LALRIATPCEEARKPKRVLEAATGLFLVSFIVSEHVLFGGISTAATITILKAAA
jgi:hypothetical protein